MHTTVSTKFVSLSGTHTLTKKTGERKREKREKKDEVRNKKKIHS